MSIDISADSYNKFTDYPLFAYNCISHLIQDTDIELLWKLLYYNDRDAWKEDASHPDLTRTQKSALIYEGSSDSTSYRVFLDFGIDDPWDVQAAQIRISPIGLEPTNYIVGHIIMALETYVHFSINTLSNYQTRVDTITQQLILSLNGANIKGFGKMYFDAKASRKCDTRVIGTIPWKGKRTIMCNWTT